MARAPKSRCRNTSAENAKARRTSITKYGALDGCCCADWFESGMIYSGSSGDYGGAVTAFVVETLVTAAE
jgi:hypothetical protein